MHTIRITVTFRGGRGALRFKIFNEGRVHGTIHWEESGEQVLELAPGVYLFSGTGLSPDGGTGIAFNAPTRPETPLTVAAGPIYKSITLHLD